MQSVGRAVDKGADVQSKSDCSTRERPTGLPAAYRGSRLGGRPAHLPGLDVGQMLRQVSHLLALLG